MDLDRVVSPERSLPLSTNQRKQTLITEIFRFGNVY